MSLHSRSPVPSIQLPPSRLVFPTIPIRPLLLLLKAPSPPVLRWCRGMGSKEGVFPPSPDPLISPDSFSVEG